MGLQGRNSVAWLKPGVQSLPIPSHCVAAPGAIPPWQPSEIVCSPAAHGPQVRPPPSRPPHSRFLWKALPGSVQTSPSLQGASIRPAPTHQPETTFQSLGQAVSLPTCSFLMALHLVPCQKCMHVSFMGPQVSSLRVCPRQGSWHGGCQKPPPLARSVKEMNYENVAASRGTCHLPRVPQPYLAGGLVP